MLNERYRKAMSETLYYLKGIKDEDVNKIPKSFIAFLEENSLKDYECDFDYTKPLKELKLLDETRGIISLICLNYWCETPEQKENFKKHLRDNEAKYQEELKKKYDINNIFNKPEKNIAKDNNQNELPAKTEKENVFKKLFNKILKLFHIK